MTSRNAGFGLYEDPELHAVEYRLRSLDPTGDRVARVIRDTFDQLYDGQHTGRWNFAQLHGTEKTHMGTLIEINLHREFGFGDGDVTDYRIAGVQVDCKFSINQAWMMPREVVDHLALVVTASDKDSTWRVGLIRVEAELLNRGPNQDLKLTLSALGRSRIRWLWPQHGRLARNLFHSLPPEAVARIFTATAASGGQHGQARTNQLFREVQRQIVRRTEVATVARQDDFMRRARGGANSGSRGLLRPEGILVLGHQEPDPRIAEELGLPIPRLGEFVAARVVPADPDRQDPAAEIEGTSWSVARSGDPVVPAPEIRKPKATERPFAGEESADESPPDAGESRPSAGSVSEGPGGDHERTRSSAQDERTAPLWTTA